MRSPRLILVLILCGLGFLIGGLVGPGEPSDGGLAGQLGPQGGRFLMVLIGAAGLASGVLLLRREYQRTRRAATTPVARRPTAVFALVAAGALVAAALALAAVHHRR